MLYDENQSKMANYYRKKPDLFGLKLAVSGTWSKLVWYSAEQGFQLDHIKC